MSGGRIVNGAEVLLRTLTAAGVEICFANPGTSEMHFVGALDAVPEMHAVLALFEGVATGAADGYARMSGRPAATLLHLGPGLGNGLANLHNARRAHSPVVNVVGDHATFHARHDAPLASDIEAAAHNVSPGFVRTCTSVDTLGTAVLDAVNAAAGPPGQVATLIVPADLSWSSGGSVPKVTALCPQTGAVDPQSVERIAAALHSDQPSALLIGGRACRLPLLEHAAAISGAAGARLLCETFPARIERGAGMPPVERLAYAAGLATRQLDGLAHLVLVDAGTPVAFFAYPGSPSVLVPDGCEVHVLAGPGDDAAVALDNLAAAIADAESVHRAPLRAPELPVGALTPSAVCAAVGALLPEGAIVSDETVTAGGFAWSSTACAARHDWLTLTGGAIGQGLPLALGAASACPDRRVIALEADGSAMYTMQALWTMAREGLDITTIVLNNGSYAVLQLELDRVGARVDSDRAASLLDLGNPDLDFVALSSGMGVPASRATTSEELVVQLRRSLATEGPTLIEAMVGDPLDAGKGGA